MVAAGTVAISNGPSATTPFASVEADGTSAADCEPGEFTTISPCGTTTTVAAGSTGASLLFTINNQSDYTENYSLNCYKDGVVTSVTCPVGPRVLARSSQTVTVKYNTSTVQGSGGVAIRALGMGSGDIARARVIIATTPAVAVSVTPDDSAVNADTRAPNSQQFTVKNNGGATTTFAVSLQACTGGATGCVLDKTSVQVTSGSTQKVTVSYTAGDSGSVGTIRVRATASGVSDDGSVAVTSRWKPWLVVDTSFMREQDRDLTICEHDCFAARFSHSSVAYATLGTPRAVTLSYNSDAVSPKQFVYADVRLVSGAPSVSEYWMELKDSLGARVQFNTGDYRLRYASAGGGTTAMRMSGVVDLGDRPTNMYRFTLLVTAVYGDHTETVTTPVRFMVINARSSEIGAGWSLLGVQRLFRQADGSALITDGSGGGQHFACTTGCAGLTQSGSGTATTYLRTLLDGTRIAFNADGYMTSMANRFGVTQHFFYESGRLARIEDPYLLVPGTAQRASIALEYANGFLSAVRPPGPFGASSGGRALVVAHEAPVSGRALLKSITDPDGTGIGFAYDGKGRLWEVRAAGGATTTFSYNDTTWKLTQVRRPEVRIDAGNGQTVAHRPTVTYRAWQGAGAPGEPTDGRLATLQPRDSSRSIITDELGREYRAVMNKWGASTRSWDALGRQTIVGRDKWVTSRRYWWDGEDKYGYHADGSLWSMQPHDKTTPAYFYYGAFGQIRRITGHQTQQDFYLGTLGQTDSMSSGGAVTRFYYDELGRDTLIVDPKGHKTRKRYDAIFGNLDRVITQNGGTFTMEMNGYGHPSVVHENGVLTKRVVLDVMNRDSLEYIGGSGSPTSFTYEAGTLTRIVDAKGQTYKFERNALGWLVRKYDAADTTRFESNRYDAAGRLVSSTNRRGQRVDRTYDAADRILSVNDYVAVADSFAYSADSRVFVAWNQSSRDSTFKNARMQTDSVVSRLGGRRYATAYRHNDFLGVIDSVGVAGEGIDFVQRVYEYHSPSGVLEKMRLNTATTWLYMDADGTPSKTIWPGNTRKDYAFSDIHTVDSAFFNVSVLDSALGRHYKHDRQGRILSERRKARDGDRTTSYAYDAAGRLERVRQEREVCERVLDDKGTPTLFDDEWVTVCSPELIEEQSFAYDPAGNRQVTGAEYGPGNRIVSWPGTRYEFDYDGNVTRRYSDGSGPASNTYFEWNALGQLTRAVNGGRDVRYFYNASGLLVQRTVGGAPDRYFLWREKQLLAELDASAAGRIGEYVYTPGVDRPFAIATDSDTGTVVRYFDLDQSGNAIGVVDGDDVVAQVGFAPWGEVRKLLNAIGDTNRLHWKGLLFEGDSTKLYYMRARWYDPQSGRFVSEDPAGLAGSANLYAFANGDPVNGRDPSGAMQTCEVWLHYVAYWRNGILMSFTVTNYEVVCWNEEALQWEGVEGKPVGVREVDKERGWCSGLVPMFPDDADLPANVRLAQGHNWLEGRAQSNSLTQWPGRTWFENQVGYEKPWDYKTRSPVYESFGNWHFGVVGKAMGWPDGLLHIGAGRAQVQAERERGIKIDWENRDPWGDHWHDHVNINLGIEFYTKCSEAGRDTK